MLPDRLSKLPSYGVSVDTETYLIRPGNLTPPLVLGSVAWWDGNKITAALLTKQQTLELFAEILEDVGKILCGANIAFDIGVLIKEFAKRGIDIIPMVFKMLMGEHTENMDGIHDGRVFDLQHAQTLDAIATGTLGKDPTTMAPLKGRYSLDQCVKLVLGREDAKANDTYRMRYGEFDDVPLEDLPPEARQYPVDDAENTHETVLAQAGFLPRVAAFHTWGPDGRCEDCGATGMGKACSVKRPLQNMHDLAAQTATAFALHMGASWGFKVDQRYVDIIEKHAIETRDEGLGPFISAGIIRPDGTENRSELKKMVAIAYGAKDTCPVCLGTGKVPSPANPKSKIICFKMADDGVTKTKTCDGTGFVLTKDVPRSEKDGIGYGRSFLVESGDEFLSDYASLQEGAKTLATLVPFLRTGRVCISCQQHGTEKYPHLDGCLMEGWKDVPLTLSPNPILDSGRVSYNGAIMTLPRKQGYLTPKGNYIPSIRECLIPRPGCVFSSEDFKNGELFAHAQSCIWLIGHSDLANALLMNIDPHAALAATTLGVTYDEFIRRKKEPLFKAARQASKPFNFGRPTGMSAVKIVLSQRAQGPDTPTEYGPSWIDDGTNTNHKIRGYKGLRFCILMNGARTCGGPGRMVTQWGKRDMPIPPTCRDCLQCAEMLAQAWLTQWSENKPYFDLVDRFVNEGMVVSQAALDLWPHLKPVFAPGTQLEPGQVMQHWSGRLRGGLEFCSLANTLFQGLLGDIAKLAFRLVARECYDLSIRVPKHLFPGSKASEFAGTKSPLQGSRPIMFAHDEIIGEHPESVAHEGATRISEVMRDCIQYICKDVAATAGADPTLMPRWFKGAEEVRDENGRLVLWKPKYVA